MGLFDRYKKKVKEELEEVTCEGIEMIDKYLKSSINMKNSERREREIRLNPYLETQHLYI